MGNTTGKIEATPQNPPAKKPPAKRRQQVVASPCPGTNNRQHPPPYKTLYPANSAPLQPDPVSNQNVEDANEDLETLRRRNMRLALDPPLPKHTSKETAEAAARNAIVGIGSSFEYCHHDPALMAAHVARAIAVAVSTSGSHTAFVAAAHAAESTALILHEAHRDKSSKARFKARVGNAIHSAVEFAMAAEAGHTATGSWPSNTQDANNVPGTPVNHSRRQPPPATPEEEFPDAANCRVDSVPSHI